MAGTIRRRGNAWTLQVYAGRKADGGQRFATRTVKGTRSEAEVELARLVIEVSAGRKLNPADRITVAELLERWLTLGAPDWSPKTLATNRQQTRDHVQPAIGHIALDRLGPHDVDGLYAELRTRLAGPTVERIHTSVLHPALEKAVRWRLIATNPADGYDPPARDDDEVIVPSVAVVRSLIGAAHPPLAAYLRTAASTGARRGTLCGLRWETVDLDARTVRFERAMVIGDDGLAEKGNKGRRAFTAVLGVENAADLARHRRWSLERGLAVGAPIDGRSFVWSPRPDATVPWRPDNVSRAFRRLREQVGAPTVRLHHLKHFAVSQMLAQGVPPAVVAQRTGTTASTIERVYAHWIPGADAQAAEVMDRLLSDGRDRRDHSA